MPKLSIVIPTYNEEKYLPKLLTSIKGQSFLDYEVIVADAKSTDATRVIATERGAKVVEGGLPSVGRNRGAQAASGELILFLDSDVILPDNSFFGRIIKEFERKKLDIATAFIKPLSPHMIDHVLHEIYNVYAVAMQKVMPHVPGFFVLVRRSLHEKIKGFNEALSFAEDHEYARRASKVGKFGILMSVRIPVSMRRFDKEGRLTIAIKYLLGEMYLIKHGQVPPEAVEYEWGYDKEMKKQSAAVTLWKNGKSLLGKSKKPPQEK